MRIELHVIDENFTATDKPKDFKNLRAAMPLINQQLVKYGKLAKDQSTIFRKMQHNGTMNILLTFNSGEKFKNGIQKPYFIALKYKTNGKT